MAICPYCKTENPDNNKFCNNCGAPLKQAEQAAADQTPPAAPPIPDSYQQVQQPAQTGSNPADVFGPNGSGYQPVHNNTAGGVEPVPIGGLIALAIFDILFCTIPGAVGLYYTLKINKATSVTEQMNTMSTAKKILYIGAGLSVLSIIVMLFGNS